MPDSDHSYWQIAKGARTLACRYQTRQEARKVAGMLSPPATRLVRKNASGKVTRVVEL